LTAFSHKHGNLITKTANLAFPTIFINPTKKYDKKFANKNIEDEIDMKLLR